MQTRYPLCSGDSLCTVRVVLLWPLTDTPTDGMSTVARQVYWPASDALTWSRVWVRDGPVPLATSLSLRAIHWSVGATVKVLVYCAITESFNTVIPPETVSVSQVQVTVVAGLPVEVQVRVN